MTSSFTNLLATLACLTACGLGLNGVVSAAAPSGERVELFAAVAAEQIDVRVIPKDATQATVIIKNKTDRPLSIQMPEAFAGVPVLAQNVGGNNAGGRGGGGGNTSTSSNQSFGGGMMGGMGGMGGMMGGGFFDIGPDRVGKLKVATVCLEHGKDDPNPRVEYELKPISEFTDKVELAEVCKMLGRGQIDQVSAQAAAWHLSDGLTFSELANKVRVKHLNGQVEMYFQPQQLQLALRAVQVAHHRAAEVRAATESLSPGEQAEAETEARRIPLSLK